MKLAEILNRGLSHRPPQTFADLQSYMQAALKAVDNPKDEGEKLGVILQFADNHGLNAHIGSEMWEDGSQDDGELRLADGYVCWSWEGQAIHSMWFEPDHVPI